MRFYFAMSVVFDIFLGRFISCGGLDGTVLELVNRALRMSMLGINTDAIVMRRESKDISRYDAVNSLIN